MYTFATLATTPCNRFPKTFFVPSLDSSLPTTSHFKKNDRKPIEIERN